MPPPGTPLYSTIKNLVAPCSRLEPDHPGGKPFAAATAVGSPRNRAIVCRRPTGREGCRLMAAQVTPTRPCRQACEGNRQPASRARTTCASRRSCGRRTGRTGRRRRASAPPRNNDNTYYYHYYYYYYYCN